MNTDEMMKEAIEGIEKYINEVVDYAINMHVSTVHTKNQVISIVVGQSIYANLSTLKPDLIIQAPQFTLGTDRIDMNRILESLGQTGIRIGAFAYVLAVRLEKILLDDGSPIEDIAKVEIIDADNHKLLGVNLPMPGFKISDCYLKYIQQDEFMAAVFLRNQNDEKKNEKITPAIL